MTVNEEFERGPDKLLTVLDQARRQALQRAELFSTLRGSAQARELARVAAKTKEDSPEVAEGSAVLLGQAVLVAGLRDDLEADRFVRSVKPGAAFAVGRVVGAAGRRPAGLRVVVTTVKNVEVATANVDRSGAFLVKPLGREQQALVAQATDLFFGLVDKAGKEIHKTRVQAPGPSNPMLVVTIDVGPVVGSRIGPDVLRPDVIPKLDDERVARLRRAGIREVSVLATADSKEIGRILDISAREASGIIRRAKTLAKKAD